MFGCREFKSTWRKICLIQSTFDKEGLLTYSIIENTLSQIIGVNVYVKSRWKFITRRKIYPIRIYRIFSLSFSLSLSLSLSLMCWSCLPYNKKFGQQGLLLSLASTFPYELTKTEVHALKHMKMSSSGNIPHFTSWMFLTINLYHHLYTNTNRDIHHKQ
jgi:hypothetical protein